MSDEPQNLVLQLLRDMRADMAGMRAELSGVRGDMATKQDVTYLRNELKSDIASLRADVASDLLTMRKELSEQIVGLRRSVVDYHTSVIGHSIIISDLEARVRRVEQHLDLPPMDAH